MKELNWEAIRSKLAQDQAMIDKSIKLDHLDPAQVAAIFQSRAEALSVCAEVESSHTKRTRVLIARLGKELYGLDLSGITEVHPLGAFVTIPGAPKEFLGVI